MDFNNYSNIVDDRARELERSRVMPFLMRKVYTWMALALTITAIVAYGIGNSPGLLMSLFGSKMPMLVLFAAEIGLVIWLSARLSRISITTATVGFIAFSILNGMTMSVFFAVYTTASIALTFFVSAGMFGAMALIGYTTKKDLSSIGGFLIMALIGALDALASLSGARYVLLYLFGLAFSFYPLVKWCRENEGFSWPWPHVESEKKRIKKLRREQEQEQQSGSEKK